MTSLAILLGKILRFVLRLRGGGSAVPGRIALLLQPRFLQNTLGKIKKGVYFVSGSNGKSTTTSMLTAILRNHGHSVLSNPAGGNLPQGLASAILADVSLAGKLQQDIAVLEVDEAYGRLIAEKVAPNGVLLTNLQFDQLNRFHSPEDVAKLLSELLALTKDFVVANGSDENTETLAKGHSHRLDALGVYASKKAISSSPHGLLAAPNFNPGESELESPARLESVKQSTATVSVGETKKKVQLPASGLHYAIDAALAIGMAKRILGAKFDFEVAVAAFDDFAPVYGRGEVIEYQNQKLEIIMMKNLPSLQANLDALTESPKRVWISVDEGTPDPSWIYDIDLSAISKVDVISGTKTYQWATRLAYEGINFGKLVEDENQALDYFLGLSGTKKTAIVNYEQMMWLRKRLGLLDLEGTNG